MLIKIINKILNINTPIIWSSKYQLEGGRNENLIGLCKNVDATEYVSGPAAKPYLNEEKFEGANLEVSYIDYSNYPRYNQMFEHFEHHVSILDLIFNEGPQAAKFMNSFS